mgnify:CR=1 FL=1
MMAKRYRKQLVDEKHVLGWDDPRMPTLSGLRRRGYTPAAIHKFIDTAGVSKRDQMIDVALLESCIRADLNKTTNRIMAVLNPLKLVITNYEGESETVMADNNPEDENAGQREMIFSKEIYIERGSEMANELHNVFKIALKTFVISETLYKKIKATSTEIKVDIRDEPWGDRHFAIQDPNGIGIDIVKYSEPESNQ